jgi:hypothetical protein
MVSSPLRAFNSGTTSGSIATDTPSSPGRQISNSVPRPTSLSQWIRPPLAVTMPYTVDRPSPVPTPTPFVVKNGSKIC